MSSLTSNVVFGVSSFCNQLSGEATVGSKVTDVETFFPILSEALASHDESNDEVKGQHCVELPITDDGQGSFTDTAVAIRKSVMAGVGKRTRTEGVPPTVSAVPLTPEEEEMMRTGSWRSEHPRGKKDYVKADHRGVVDCYLKREFALSVESVRVIVYTVDAYKADPQVPQEEYERVMASADDVTHVIVAVLADAGPKAPLSPRRFVANLAGGNNVMLERLEAIEDALYEAPSPEQVTAAIKALRALTREAAEVTAYDEKYCVVAD
jgi:hypothetical protein